MSDSNDEETSSVPAAVGKDHTDGKPPAHPEVLEKLPPEVRKVVESISLQAFSTPVFNPILNKITEKHIDKVLDQNEKDSDREFDDHRSIRRFNLGYVLIFAVLFVFLVVYLVDRNPELLKDMVKYLFVFAGGYGFKAFMDRRGVED